MTLEDKLSTMTDKEKREYLGLQIERSDSIEDNMETRLGFVQDRKAELLAILATIPP